MSEQFRHTPGPWEIEPKERRSDPLYVMSKEGDRIAKCDGINVADFVSDEQCKGNANLIAAAPELLDACKECVGLLTHLGLAVLESAKAAISKAEGK